MPAANVSVDVGAFPISVSVADASVPPIERPWDALKRFTADEYHAMIQAVVFAEDANFELLEGLIVRKMTINPPHWIAAGSLRDALIELRLTGFFVHSKEPVTIRSSDSAQTRDSEPEPDVALVLGKRRDYVTCSPGPERTPLVVEVADSTLAQDRTWKKRIYARAGVPVYWIVNLVDRQVEIYTRPTGPSERPDFGDCQIVPDSGEVAVVIEGKEVGRLKVSEIMP